ncbi:MAG: hypothetical protein V2A73_11845 [Pseudomonadota bacterium]
MTDLANGVLPRLRTGASLCERCLGRGRVIQCIPRDFGRAYRLRVECPECGGSGLRDIPPAGKEQAS